MSVTGMLKESHYILPRYTTQQKMKKYQNYYSVSQHEQPQKYNGLRDRLIKSLCSVVLLAYVQGQYTIKEYKHSLKVCTYTEKPIKKKRNHK